LSLTEGVPRVDGLKSDVQSTLLVVMLEMVGACESINKRNIRIITTVPQMWIKAYTVSSLLEKRHHEPVNLLLNTAEQYNGSSNVD